MNTAAEIEYLIKTKSDLGGLQSYVRAQQEQVAAQRASGQSTDALEQGLRNLITNYRAAVSSVKAATAEQAAYAAELDKVEESLVRVNAASAAGGDGRGLGNRTLNVGATTSYPTGLTSDKGSGEAAAREIQTQREYEQATQLYQAYMSQMTAKRLLGEEDEKLAAKIGALEAAMSTERALVIAETIEEEAAAKKAAVAELELAEAMNAGALAARNAREAADTYALKQQTVQAQLAAAAARELAEAEEIEAVAAAKAAEKKGLSALATTELGRITRDIGIGNIGRMASSLSILAKELGLGTGEIIAFTAALFAGVEIYKEYEKSVKNARGELTEFTKQQELSSLRIQDAIAKQADALASFNQKLDETANKAFTVTEVLSNMNRLQSESQQLADAVKKTQEDASLGATEDIKDPVQRAMAQAAIKRKAQADDRNAADAAGRAEYKNANDALVAAQGQYAAGRTSETSLGGAADTAQSNLFRAQEERKRRDSVFSRLQKDFSLSDDEIDTLKNNAGKINGIIKDLQTEATGSGSTVASLQNSLFKRLGVNPGDGIAELVGSLSGLPALGAGAQGHPYDAIFTGQRNKEFGNALGQINGLNGGYGSSDADQDKRIIDLQHVSDTAVAAYDKAKTSTEQLATQVDTLNKKFAELGETLNAASALRNQKGIDDEIKNLQDVLRVVKTESTELEKKNLEFEKRGGTVAPGSSAIDNALHAAITTLSQKIEQLATAHASSTAFTYFNTKGGAPLGPRDVPPIDFSGVSSAFATGWKKLQEKVDQLQKQIQSIH